MVDFESKKGWQEIFKIHCSSYYDILSKDFSLFPKEEYMKKVVDISNYFFYIGMKNDIMILSPISSKFVYYKIVTSQMLDAVHTEVMPIKLKEFKKKFKEPTDDEKAFLLLKNSQKTVSENKKAIFLHRYDMMNDVLYCVEADEVFCYQDI